MKDYTAWIPAIGHEIHCLAAIKHLLGDYQKGKSSTPKDLKHANHCIEVIRQSLMCNPDWHIPIPDWWDEMGAPNFADFWGGEKHICRDQKMLHEFLVRQNMGFTYMPGELDKDGHKVIKAWSWPIEPDSQPFGFKGGESY